MYRQMEEGKISNLMALNKFKNLRAITWNKIFAGSSRLWVCFPDSDTWASEAVRRSGKILLPGGFQLAVWSQNNFLYYFSLDFNRPLHPLIPWEVLDQRPWFPPPSSPCGQQRALLSPIFIPGFWAEPPDSSLMARVLFPSRSVHVAEARRICPEWINELPQLLFDKCSRREVLRLYEPRTTDSR